MAEYFRWPKLPSFTTSTSSSNVEILSVENMNVAPVKYVEGASSTASSSSASSMPETILSMNPTTTNSTVPNVSKIATSSSSTSSSAYSYYHPSCQTENTEEEVTSIFLSIDGKFEKIDLSKENCEIFKDYLEKLKNGVNLKEISEKNKFDEDSQELWVVVKPCDITGDPKKMYNPNTAPAEGDEKTSLIDDDDDGFVVVQMEHFQQSLGELVADVLYEHYHPKRTIFNQLSSKISSKFVTVNVPPPQELRALLIRALSQSNSFTSERMQSALSVGRYAYFTYGWTSTIYWLARQPWISGIVIAGAAKLTDCALMLLL